MPDTPKNGSHYFAAAVFHIEYTILFCPVHASLVDSNKFIKTEAL
jgi:hypothetical protein